MKKQPKLKWYQRGFVVVLPGGYQSVHTIRHLRKDAINLICQWQEKTWRQLYRRGFRCVRVTITPAPAKKGKR